MTNDLLQAAGPHAGGQGTAAGRQVGFRRGTKARQRRVRPGTPISHGSLILLGEWYQMTVGSRAAKLVVSLMILLRAPEDRRGRDLGGNRRVKDLGLGQGGLDLLGDLLLFGEWVKMTERYWSPTSGP